NAMSAAESVYAAPGYEAALDMLLREVSKSVVVDTSDVASTAIRRLRERGAGRGAFIALDYVPHGEGTRRGDAAHSVMGEGAVASEEQTLYVEEKDQLLARKHAAIAELEELQAREQELHNRIRTLDEELTVSRTAFEDVTEVASKARVDVESASGNVNAVQREHENLS